MGKLTPSGDDQYRFSMAWTFTAPGSSDPVPVEGAAWVLVSGSFSGAGIAVEGSLDGGTTWVPLFASTALDPLVITTPGMLAIPGVEQQTLMRLTAQAGFTGTAACRISGGWVPGRAPR